jgi:hypothetical protein
MNGYAMALVCAVYLPSDWLPAHQFVAVLLAIAGMASFIAIGATRRFKEPCSNRGWNIKLAKQPHLRPSAVVLSVCPHCGADLERDP